MRERHQATRQYNISPDEIVHLSYPMIILFVLAFSVGAVIAWELFKLIL